MKCYWSRPVSSLFFFLAVWPNNSVFGSSEPGLTLVTDCVCPGHIATFRCTVQGGLLTVWEGTAFDCPSSEILLTNSDFGTPTAFGVCNNGDIFGRGLSVDRDRYTSELNVTFEPMLQGRTVICSVDNGTDASEVDRKVLRASTEPFPPLSSVTLTQVNSTELVFSWNQTQRCPSVHYNITASSNCGNCPSTTSSTSVSCSNFTTSEYADTSCTFMVQTVVCGDGPFSLIGNSSSPISVNLTVPRVHQLSSIPHYHLDNGLRGITVSFSTAASFFISDEIKGSIESYTVTYSDVHSGALCYSQTIPANDSVCSTGANVCIAEFNVSSSMCPQSTDVNTTVLVSTNLGDGPKSDPIIEEYQNSYVMVEVISQTTSINCTFPERISGAIDNSCNATIVYGPICRNRTNLIGEIINDSLISIGLRSFLEQTTTSRYCGFVVNVTAGEKFLTVEGTIDFVTLLDRGNNAAVAAAVSITVVSAALILALVSAVITLAVLFRRRTRRVQEYEMNTIRSRGLSIKIPEIHVVDETYNMINFARSKHPTYNPDSGTGYFQLQPGSEEYISSTTEVVLINEDRTEMSAGPEARQLLGFRNKKQPIKIPESFKWKYVFIQSTSRIRVLLKGTHFIIYPEDEELISQNRSLSLSKSKDAESDTQRLSMYADPVLQIVEEQYHQLYDVLEECVLPKFVEQRNITTRRNLGLGYCFYEFNMQELIPYNKQVILMDKNGDFHYGPKARRVIGLNPGYDEAVEIQPPNFSEDSRWKKAFVSTTSNVRKLRPETHFLYCTVATKETEKVNELFKIFEVTEENEDSRKLIKFARSKIPDYDPTAGYGYYEFTKKGYVLREKNVIALKRNGQELYTGLGVRRLIGAAEDYDPTQELDPPTFTESDEWDCIFIQGKSFGRILDINTRFLYCEYDPKKE